MTDVVPSSTLSSWIPGETDNVGGGPQSPSTETDEGLIIRYEEPSRTYKALENSCATASLAEDENAGAKVRWAGTN
jgi:hypothetical protein